MMMKADLKARIREVIATADNTEGNAALEIIAFLLEYDDSENDERAQQMFNEFKNRLRKPGA